MSERNDSIDPNVNVSGRQSYFNEDAKFFKDVYIYGKLYYEFEDKDVVEIFKDANFKGDVYIDGNLNVGILTVRKRLDVGIGGTVLRAIADLEGLPFTSGKVGIANTFPKQTLDVLGTAIISEKVGIGTTSPKYALDVVGTTIISEKVGIGTTSPKYALDVVGTTIISEKVGIGGTTIPEQVLDVSGSVKIDANIFDSANSPGKNGYQLVRDAKGIRWISMFAQGATPGVGFGTIVGIQTDGFFVLDDGIPIY